MNEFGLKEPHHLYIIDLVACTISAIASLVMVYFCLRIPSENRAASIKFIFAVALSDFFYSFGNGMAVFQNSPEIYCNIEGFFRHTALVFSSLFAACTAIVSYGTSLSPKMTKAKTYLFYLLIFGFVFFGGLALFGPIFFPNTLHYRDQDNLGCSLALANAISNVERGIFYILTKGVPIALALFVVIVGYFLCLKQIKEIPEEYLQRLGVKPYYLLIYPITLIITFLPSSFLHVFITLAHTKTPPIWLLLLRSVVTHSVGLWNAIMYILFRKLYQVPKKYELSEEQIDEYQQYSSHSSEEEEEL